MINTSCPSWPLRCCTIFLLRSVKMFINTENEFLHMEVVAPNVTQFRRTTHSTWLWVCCAVRTEAQTVHFPVRFCSWVWRSTVSQHCIFILQLQHMLSPWLVLLPFSGQHVVVFTEARLHLPKRVSQGPLLHCSLAGCQDQVQVIDSLIISVDYCGLFLTLTLFQNVHFQQAAHFAQIAFT